ncbi:acetyltransferase (GNAT) domain-containing protein [Hirsutella rhossiliensis]|uniref:Acetyltransferase (GNAT) domain-containing protein n=1 Tax=Hirsutella rhossiliensis TaxID=111463 RepID=A0A9P8N2G1_9HYPO|nr:acetyltransferase (GNAT) domain-containing protein [Hirsutella rhossiliensis]KAH0965392.1 acetyltransferase (GNAT) domain-containing protein [Hirsutella rhossiliensis]
MTPPQLIHLPDGQMFTVSPVFAGVGFRSHGHGAHHHPYPVGWTVVLHTDEDELAADAAGRAAGGSGVEAMPPGTETEEEEERRRRSRPFTLPTRRGDSLFISSIANPPASEFKPAASPTRQMAMLLWVTLYWYFHHPPPPPPPPPSTAAADWRVRVRPDGALHGRGLLAKLERMGLVACADAAVAAPDAAATDVFVSQPMFWQIPGRLFLYAPEPIRPLAPDASPVAGPSPAPGGPFTSTSHLPTYYPPAPLQYVATHGVRHPLRPRPPRMGDVLYSRFVPSAGRYLAFRVASSSPEPVPYLGPVGPVAASAARGHAALVAMSDVALLEAWHANPRVAEFWGPFVPGSLDRALHAPHSFPVIGLWDGVPFGYFELYWAKEDLLGRHVAGEMGDWDRGVHIMVGEEWARGKVALWLTSLVHWCLTADLRTMNVCLEPRIDNHRILRHLDALGFDKEKQVALPHKQAWYVRLRRECWQGPAL